MSETRKLAAILVADIVGYSRLAGANEERTLARLRGLRSDLIDPAIAAHHGRIVKRTGDGSIVEFRSVVDAVRCAIEVQNGLIERNAGLPLDRRIEFRVGVHLGDVVEEEDGDLMGDGVNIAARLESIAKPGAICLSEARLPSGQGTVRDRGQRSRHNPTQEHRRAHPRLFPRSGRSREAQNVFAARAQCGRRESGRLPASAAGPHRTSRRACRSRCFCLAFGVCAASAQSIRCRRQAHDRAEAFNRSATVREPEWRSRSGTISSTASRTI